MEEPQESAQGQYVPAGAILDTWAREAWDNGVQIDRLEELETLAVRTVNNIYEITILCGRTGEVLVRGGRYFPEFTPAIMAGATLGGCFIKLRGIYVCFRMEFHVEEQVIINADGPQKWELPDDPELYPIAQNLIITSPVQAIGVVI